MCLCSCLVAVVFCLIPLFAEGWWWWLHPPSRPHRRRQSRQRHYMDVCWERRSWWRPICRRAAVQGLGFRSASVQWNGTVQAGTDEDAMGRSLPGLQLVASVGICDVCVCIRSKLEHALIELLLPVCVCVCFVWYAHDCVFACVLQLASPWSCLAAWPSWLALWHLINCFVIDLLFVAGLVGLLGTFNA